MFLKGIPTISKNPETSLCYFTKTKPEQQTQQNNQPTKNI